jgi:hypothetical protein
MNAADKYLLLADTMLTVHFLLVSFVVAGFVAIVVGRWLNWHWVFNSTFRWIHVAIMALIALQALLGRVCPLTTWENTLRRQAGSAVYNESFIQHWLHRLLFFDAPFWVFTTIYIIFAAVVLLIWLHDRRRV